MDILIGILTSKDQQKLKRCVESVLPQTTNVVVVCNTLDLSYVKEAQKIADDYGLKFIVTESNGTPGKGKNSLKDYFLSTESTHMIPIDGDDYLLPNAVNVITKIINTKNPDVIGLIDGLVLLDGETMTAKEWQEHPVLWQRSIDITEPKNLKRLNLHIEKIRRISLEHGNFFNRIVLLSRKAAEHVDYDEKLSGAEDIKQSSRFKLMQQQNLINYVILSSQRIYVYDVTDLGACVAVCKTDPVEEGKLFWSDITKEQINILRSFELELIHD